ncbi:MAG: glycosyltransferase [Fibrobacterota bacterium]|nr:glycosyltransferase [Fibrobacterota bacterium]QQS05689.1 MAG: glycosyltransferase [Fibrobacterota bacterium]
MGQAPRPQGQIILSQTAFLAPSLGIGFAAFHVAFFRWLWRGLHAKAKRQIFSQETTATILVAARNEAKNLQRLLPALLGQSCDKIRLQIVVIDDRSTDGTDGILSEFADRIEVVRVDELPPGRAPKKHALNQGLARAKGEFVLQIDADNLPGPTWASTMLSYFGPRTGAVCGLVFHCAKSEGVPAWFHGIWALEATGWAAVQASAIGAGMPISANGGNLAYRRKAFDSVRGFAGHLGVISGDDDFLVQSLADSGQWEVVSADAPETLVETAPPGSWKEVWEQRKRWGSKCIRYDPKRVGLLSVVYGSYVWIVASLVWGLWSPWAAFGGAVTLAMVLAEAFFLTLRMARMTARSRLLVWFPLAMAVQIPVVVLATLMGTFGRFRWKGQQVGAKA